MLGVFKRRWKPKRASSGGTRFSNEINPFEQEKPRLAPSVRQVHPACDEKKAQVLAYDASPILASETHPKRPSLEVNASPPPYPKRASLDSNPSPTAYPLAPNICVEAGRIEFIKLSPDGATDAGGVATPASNNSNATTNNTAAANATIITTGSSTNHGQQPSPPPSQPMVIDHNLQHQQQRITVTRGSQTGEEEDEEKCEREKEDLRSRIAELEAALEAAHDTERRDKQSLSKLHKQLSRLREAAQRDADRERRLRADSEARAKQALQEAARCRSRLKLLTHEFSRMEETVRSMLVYKSRAEQLRQEKAALTVAFESRCQQYQSTVSRLNQEVSSLRQQLEQVNSEPGLREGVLQAHSVALHRQAEESRKQYERCLDDVANQVVKALLAQKGLREEITNLHKRIEELESQNQALTSMLVHQLRGDSTIASVSDLDLSTGSATNHLALEDPESHIDVSAETTTADLQDHREENNGHDSNNTSADISPSNLMKTSLNVKHCNSFDSDILEHSCTIESSTADTLISDSTALTRAEKHLSADSARIIDKQLSLEDKKRHQILTKLWTDLKGTEVTPKRLLEALSVIDPALWVPPQRPVSLNLQLPILPGTKYRCRNRSILVQASSKSEEETTGNESPESSGNRDEGYSTMSSDVQAELSKASGECPASSSTAIIGRGLEDLKEATDEGGCEISVTGGSAIPMVTTTTTTTTTETRLLLAEKNDPDVLYIPLNLLGVNPRNSYPPTKDILPFQHIMRSFSDSHLCIKITTSPSPCYSLSSPISSTPSILFLDITDKKMNPLRRVKAAASLLGNGNVCEDQSTAAFQSSWSSPSDECLKCTALDAEYIQHWLRLDETRSALQQHHRDMLELEYDRAELEDWSLSLSNDDLRGEHSLQKRTPEAMTPGQISISTTLPSIQEHNTLELEEDSNECLWNNSSYMMDREGHELVALLMDANDCQIEKQWPYAIQGALNLNTSPDNSWSSNGSDCCNSYEPETCSKRSSAALSGCSDDTGELPAIGTDFTRDFYRLVKFESTKSLASTSSRSLGGALSENGDREMALQNVLTFIAEQQKYAHNRVSNNLNDTTNNKESPQLPPMSYCHPGDHLNNTDDHIHHHHQHQQQQYQNMEEGTYKLMLEDENNYVTLKQLATEYTLNEQNSSIKDNIIDDVIVPNISYAEEVCLVTPLDVESENCSNITERPVDICSSAVVSVETVNSMGGTEDQQTTTMSSMVSGDDIEASRVINDENCGDKQSGGSDECDSDLAMTKSGDTLSNSDIMNVSTLSESVTSSTSTPDTVVCSSSKIPRLRQSSSSKIPVSPNKSSKNSHNQSSGSSPVAVSKLPKSKLQQSRKTGTVVVASSCSGSGSKISRPIVSAQKQKIVQVVQNSQPQHVITSERLPQYSAGVISNIIDGPPHRAVSFHERATSKDVIDELNRMIQKGDESSGSNNTVGLQQERPGEDPVAERLDEACKPTGWIHVEKDIDLTDPKARANLLDVMMASVSSDSSPTSSCGGSITSDSPEEVSDYKQLHRIHKYHRQKKVNMARPELAVVRAAAPQSRPSIIGRPNFFMRYGEKEREAVASFDFLDELSTSSGGSGASFVDEESSGGDGGSELVTQAAKRGKVRSASSNGDNNKSSTASMVISHYFELQQQN